MQARWPIWWLSPARATLFDAPVHDWADRTNQMLVQALPAKYVSDPAYVFEQTEPNINLFTVLQSTSQKMQDEMTQLVSALMQHFGTQTRVFIASLTKP